MMYFQISCSHCGHLSQKLPYDPYRTPDKITSAGWDSFGSAFYCPKCVKSWEKRNGNDRPVWGRDHTERRCLEVMVDELKDEVDYLNTGERSI